MSLRIHYSQFTEFVKTYSYAVVDDSGRGGCVATRMSAAGRLASGPEKNLGSSESSPLQSGTAAQQGVSRGQDRAAVGNDWSAAAGKFQLSPGWCFMDLPTRAGVKPALGNKAVEE